MKRIMVSSILICSAFLVQSMQKNNFHFTIAQHSSDTHYILNTIDRLIKQWCKNEIKTSQKQRIRYEQIRILASHALSLKIPGDTLLKISTDSSIIEFFEKIIQQECDSTAPDFVVVNKTTTPIVEDRQCILQ